MKPDAEPQIDIEQVNVWDLLEAFDSLMKATGSISNISHINDDTPIDLYQIEILHRLQTDGQISFERLFEPKTSLAVMIGLFLALLELIRERLVWVEQSAPSASIYLRPLTDEPAQQAVQKAILAAAQEDKTSRTPQTQQQKQPPIAITDLPPESKPALPIDEYQQTEPAKDHK